MLVKTVSVHDKIVGGNRIKNIVNVWLYPKMFQNATERENVDNPINLSILKIDASPQRENNDKMKVYVAIQSGKRNIAIYFPQCLRK